MKWGILMGKWVGLGFSRVSVLKTIIVFIIAIIVMSYLFRYLVKSNKIKPSKLSKLFYMDDEQYVKYWGKERRKGKIKFVIYMDVIISITIWVASIVVIAATDGDFSKLKNTLPIFYGYLIGSTIGYPLRWNINEKKYKELTKNIE